MQTLSIFPAQLGDVKILSQMNKELIEDEKSDNQMTFMPAVSIYFDDPDGHSVEFIAMLDDEPRPDLEIMSWKEWDRLHER